MANFEAFVEKIGGRWFKVGDVIVEICASNSGFLKNEITWDEHYEMNYTKIKDQLIKHEGLRLKPYKCTAGKMTIGVGRNLDDVGISEQEALDMLFNDVGKCLSDLREIFRQFDQLPENIQLVLVDMRFQLGSSVCRKSSEMAYQPRDCREINYCRVWIVLGRARTGNPMIRRNS